MQELHRYDACPLCESGNIEEYAIAKCDGHPMWKPALSSKILWMRCNGCGHSFRSGYYTAEACALIFADVQDSQRVGHEMELHRVASARMIDRVLPYRDGGRWLDVGFGNASLLMTAQEYGFEPVGIDLRQGNVDALNAFGIEAHCCEIGAVEGRFDVISMCDVLEHIAHPKDALVQARGRLDDGGALLLSMPNMDAPVWRAWDLAGCNPYWKELEHCHNFGRARLYALLAECGFRPVQYGVSERYRACMEVIATKG